MSETIEIVPQSETAQKLSESCGCPCVDLTELADKSFPKMLSTLPVVKVSGAVRSVRFVSTDIVDEIPTEDELILHIKSILDNYQGDIQGWLMKLGLITIPGFVGEEPTIEEFFSEEFDSNRIKPRYVLVSYPVIKSGV